MEPVEGFPWGQGGSLVREQFYKAQVDSFLVTTWYRESSEWREGWYLHLSPLCLSEPWHVVAISQVVMKTKAEEVQGVNICESIF